MVGVTDRTDDAERPGRPAERPPLHRRARLRAPGIADQQHRHGGVGGLGRRARTWRRCSSPSSSSPLPRRAAVARRARGTLYRTRAAGAASIALGVAGGERARPRGERRPRRDRARARDEPGAVAGRRWCTRSTARSASTGSSVVRGDDLEWLRDWFCDYVRGGARCRCCGSASSPTACCRSPGCRSAPPLAARHAPRVAREDGRRPVQHVDGLARAPRPTLSPVSGATAPSGEAGEEAVTVASVLGAIPHPGRLRLRAAPDEFLQLRRRVATKLDDFAHLAGRGARARRPEFVRDKYAEQELDPRRRRRRPRPDHRARPPARRLREPIAHLVRFGGDQPLPPADRATSTTC